MALTEEGNNGIPATMLVGPANIGGGYPYPIYQNSGNGNNGLNGDGWWIILLLLLVGANGWGNNGGGMGFGGGGNRGQRARRGGYSSYGSMVERLEELMNDAPDMRTRQEIERLINNM